MNPSSSIIYPTEIESLRQQLSARDAEIAELKAALQAVSDDWDGEHFHNGGDSFMPAVIACQPAFPSSSGCRMMSRGKTR